MTNNMKELNKKKEAAKKKLLKQQAVSTQLKQRFNNNLIIYNNNKIIYGTRTGKLYELTQVPLGKRTESEILKTGTEIVLKDIYTKTSMREVERLYNNEYGRCWTYGGEVYGVKPGRVDRIDEGPEAKPKVNLYDVKGYDPLQLDFWYEYVHDPKRDRHSTIYINHYRCVNYKHTYNILDNIYFKKRYEIITRRNFLNERFTWANSYINTYKYENLFYNKINTIFNIYYNKNNIFVSNQIYFRPISNNKYLLFFSKKNNINYIKKDNNKCFILSTKQTLYENVYHIEVLNYYQNFNNEINQHNFEIRWLSKSAPNGSYYEEFKDFNYVLN